MTTRSFKAGQRVTVSKDGQRIPGTVFRRIFADGTWLFRVDTAQGRLTVRLDQVERNETSQRSADIAEALVEGTVIRFAPATSKGKITVRLAEKADVHLTEKGHSYVVMTGYRVRPDDYNVSFSKRRLYCVNIDRIEIVRKGRGEQI